VAASISMTFWRQALVLRLLHPEIRSFNPNFVVGYNIMTTSDIIDVVLLMFYVNNTEVMKCTLYIETSLVPIYYSKGRITQLFYHDILLEL